MSLFNKSSSPVTPREELENKFRASRSNLLFAIIVTAINILLTIIGTDFYFLFSITTPFILVSTGMYLCGMFPDEYYADLGDYTPFDSSLFVVLLVLALVLLSFYFIVWLFSAKHKTGLLIAALVLFIGDTLFAFSFLGISFDCLIEMLFHAWIIYYLVIGITSSRKLKKLPPDEPTTDEAQNITEDPENSEAVSSSHIRVAEENAKHRVLLEVKAEDTPFGKRVCYRRVGKVNELVIGNYVYDEYEALMEMPHTLRATIDGHMVEASLDNMSRSVIKIDGVAVAKKMRLV